MRKAIETLRKNNLTFYTDLIIELGMLRTTNKCALCFKKVDILNYHIQMCRRCRDSLWDMNPDKHIEQEKRVAHFKNNQKALRKMTRKIR